MEKVKNYFFATRPMFFTAIVLPVVFGSAFAWRAETKFNAMLFILMLFASISYHAGMNVINDYFDWLNGSDNANKIPLTPFTGGSRMIQNGKITPLETLVFAITLLSIGTLIGIYLAYLKGWILLLIGGVGLFTGFFYSAPPIAFSSRGFGEAFVGLNFGILAVLGAYFTQTSIVTKEVFFASLPFSFLIAGVLYINEFPDYEADRSSGKKTLVVRMGLKKARWGGAVIFLFAYSSIVIAVMAGYLPMLSLITLFSSVFALNASIGLIKNYNAAPFLLPSIKNTVAAHAVAGVLLIFTVIIS